MVFGHGHVELAEAGAHFGGEPVEGLGALAHGGEHAFGGALGGAGGKHLVVLAAVAVDGDALAVEFMRQVVDLAHVLLGGVVGQVDGLGDGVVGVLLEGGLHADVPLRGHVVGGHEDLLDIFGNALDVAQASLGGHGPHEFVGVETACLGFGLEPGVDFGELVVVHDIAHEAQREQGFDAAGAVGDDAQGAGGRDGGQGGVAHGRDTPGVVGAFVEVSERSARGGQGLGGAVGFGLDELHDLLGQGQGLFGVVGDAHLEEQIGEAHHAQSHLAVALHHVMDGLQGEPGHVDGVVQEAHGGPDHVLQLLVIHGRGLGVRAHAAGQVDGAQVAGFHGQQGLFSARVGALDLSDGRRGVVAVEAVEEDDAGVAVLPGLLDQRVVYLPGLDAFDGLAGARVDEFVGLVVLQGGHEGVGQAHGDVEVVQVVVVLLAVDELHDVRVVDPEDGHVGAAPGAALLDLLGGGVEDLHERHRARGHPAGGAHGAVLGPQAREGKPGSAAGLVDDRGVFQGFEDAFHGVFHGQHETGRELSQAAPGVHQGGRVGQKLQVGHQAIEGLGRLFDISLRIVPGFRLGDVPGHAVEHVHGRLDGFAVFVLAQVAPGQDGLGVFRKAQGVGDEKAFVQGQVELLGQAVVLQGGLQDGVHDGRRDAGDLQLFDGLAHEAAHRARLRIVHLEPADQDFGEQLVVQAVIGQIDFALVHLNHFCFFNHGGPLLPRLIAVTCQKGIHADGNAPLSASPAALPGIGAGVRSEAAKCIKLPGQITA